MVTNSLLSLLNNGRHDVSCFKEINRYFAMRKITVSDKCWNEKKEV